MRRCDNIVGLIIMYGIIREQFLFKRSTKVFHPNVKVDSTAIMCGISDINGGGGPLPRMASPQGCGSSRGVVA